MTALYDWQNDDAWANPTPQPIPQPTPQQVPQQPSRSRSERVAEAATAVGGAVGSAASAFAGGAASSVLPPININIGGGNGGDGGDGGDGGGGTAMPEGSGSSGSFHQGDRLIYAVEKIEIRGSKDIIALAKAINRLGRELHLILGMRAEEINGVLSQYKGAWYTFGASSRIKARLVSAHLKVSAEAAKALGVGALRMAYAFDRHFVKPEQAAKAARNGGKKAGREFRIEDV
ncbi:MULTISPECIES: hypothetical protein [Streptomyces]|uniref:hypothetical protein n=1 Tax=Streptomyces TaxID=1883 RepID=UPI0033C13FAA